MRKQDSLARLIATARRRVKQIATQRAARHRLSAQQFWVMVHLGAVQGGSLRAMCDGLRMDAPTASRVVTALARRGLVRSAVDAADRRRMSLVLTPRGRALSAELQPVAEEIRSAVERDLTTTEAAILRRLLGKVIASLDRHHAEGDAA